MGAATIATGHSHLVDRSPPAQLARAVGICALLVSAYVHLRLAPSRQFGLHPITLGDLFALQGALCVVAAGWLAWRGSARAWMAGLVVCAVSLTSVVLSRYHPEMRTGLFPSLYEPVWYRDKTLSAIAEAGFLPMWMLTAYLRRR